MAPQKDERGGKARRWPLPDLPNYPLNAPPRAPAAPEADEDGRFYVRASDLFDPENAAGGAPAGGAPGGGAPGIDTSRWWGRAPPVLPDDWVKPPSPARAPVTLAAEDGHWYRMKPENPDVDAPPVRARSPASFEAAALAYARDHRGRKPQGGATPWPEQAGPDQGGDPKWYTLDRHQVVRQQEAWETWGTSEAADHRGGYDEWNMCDPADCVKPRYYDVQDRWWQMPPVDDGTAYKKPPPPEAPKGDAFCATNGRPWEDGSKWYKIPNGKVGPVTWREC
jgi:hypothetical protein